MSTLPPTPTYNPNVPIVSSAGGGTAAYKDPNSPESIMKKTATLDAQATVDSRYDVKEGFKARIKAKQREQKRTGGASLILLVLIILFIITIYKFLKFSLKVFIVILATILLIVSISIYKNV